MNGCIRKNSRDFRFEDEGDLLFYVMETNVLED